MKKILFLIALLTSGFLQTNSMDTSEARIALLKKSNALQRIGSNIENLPNPDRQASAKKTLAIGYQNLSVAASNSRNQKIAHAAAKKANKLKLTKCTSTQVARKLHNEASDDAASDFVTLENTHATHANEKKTRKTE